MHPETPGINGVDHQRRTTRPLRRSGGGNVGAIEGEGGVSPSLGMKYFISWLALLAFISHPGSGHKSGKKLFLR